MEFLLRRRQNLPANYSVTAYHIYAVLKRATALISAGTDGWVHDLVRAQRRLFAAKLCRDRELARLGQ
jgi:hypothetical protein